MSQGSVQASGNEPALVRSSEDSSLSDESIANCRYGIVAGGKQAQHVSRIGAGWFLDFNPPKTPKSAADNNAEFVHVFKTFQEKTEDGHYLPAYRTIVPLDANFISYLQANPGDLWIIGNEVDRGPNRGEIVGGQGDMYPEIYARAYYEVRAFIKKYDPTARTAISGLVQVTPSRLQYLDRVWAAHRQLYGSAMQVDVWNMHIYVLPELEPDGITPNGIANIALGTDPSLGKRSSGNDSQLCSDPNVYCYAEHDDLAVFGEQVVAMRQWMKAHGQQQKPLIISEFSILYPYSIREDGCFLRDEYGNCFTPNRVSTFMTHTFNYLNHLQDEDLGYTLDEDRLVQQWLWFSIFTEYAGNVSNILERDQQTLTQVGKTFQQAVYAEPEVVNLLIDKIPKVTASVDHNSGKATARLQITFRNNGNTAVDEPFTITFYRDAARTNEIASVLIPETVRGCTTNSYGSFVEWPDLPVGTYPFWVTVDSGDVIVEGPPGQQDNLGSGLVTVYPESSFIPAVAR